ncbi:HPP family protein [Siminovitchia acidinfaciens]|uniref:HPP family protein n=1 Tax=Siminovitchia acidinfaciens TaxID=2321395 RepID=A0A429Y7W6_9BACI|nr:HPP family protein [Siminovitchia acidinfaciens]RST77500.1 HPP family protein [Siminovitchia acidinfaciens]
MESQRVTDQVEKYSVPFPFTSKMKGAGVSPLTINVKDAMTGLLGGFLTISVLAILTGATSTEWLMAPFGASCVLAFGVWNAPLSQPRNIIGGHLISTFVGLAVYHTLGNESWAIGLAVGLAIAALMLTKTTHPPAGANPLVVMMGDYDWSFLFSPVLIGSVIVVVFALVINNLRSDRDYPTFWI